MTGLLICSASFCSFKESIIKLTYHNDIQVNIIFMFASSDVFLRIIRQ